MTTPQPILTSSEVFYPESDGKPMADNTKQFHWIVVIEQNLEWLFAEDATVFVAGDLLWYPIEGNNTLCTAPDALVAFGRPKCYWNRSTTSPNPSARRGARKSHLSLSGDAVGRG